MARHLQRQTDAVELALLDIGNDSSVIADEEPPKNRCTRNRKPILAKRNKEGEMEPISPRESWWFSLYVDCPMVDDSRFHRTFRARFQLPYEQFLELVEDSIEERRFPRFLHHCSTSPIELLILGGALRYLGRGFTLDDYEENKARSRQVHQVFFHEFITIGSTVLFDRYVVTPKSPEEAMSYARKAARLCRLLTTTEGGWDCVPFLAFFLAFFALCVIIAY